MRKRFVKFEKNFIMKKAFIITIVVLLCFRINAQTLTGVVYDKDTKQPIPSVYVSFNGTTAYTITDNSGKFEFSVTQRFNTQLVFSHVAYQTVIIENPFNEFPKEIYMEQRINMLSDVILIATPDPFSREQKLAAFREQFLGTTRAGRSCMIMNEGDIHLWYNVEKNTLSASANKPLVVINEYLGYIVSFTLVDFKIEYAIPQSRSLNNPFQQVTNVRSSGNAMRLSTSDAMRLSMGQKNFAPLNSDNVQRSYFLAMSLFTDLSPDDERIKRRRDEIYEQSSTFFFKNIANNTLNESNFEIYVDRRIMEMKDTSYFKVDKFDNIWNIKLSDVSIFSLNRRHISVDQSLFFTVEDSLSLKKICFVPDLGSIINVRYRNRSSTIQFNIDTLLVDRYGNIDQPYKVIFTGAMGESRAGDMLPMDYEP